MNDTQLLILALAVSGVLFVAVRVIDLLNKRQLVHDAVTSDAAGVARVLTLRDRDQIDEILKQQREDINALQEQARQNYQTVVRQATEMARLAEENKWLRAILRQNGINVPDLPDNLKPHPEAINISIINAAQGAQVDQAAAGKDIGQSK